MLDELQSERSGSRLKKLVSEARAGHSEVPQQVAYVSVEPLTARAIERSWELIQAHGWHHLVLKSALLVMLAVCLVCCTSSTPIDPQKLPTFGDSLPGTIHVMALQGFKRPGHYHLPKGASLGLLLDLAELEPISPRLLNCKSAWHFIAVGAPRPAKIRLMIDRDTRSVSVKDRKHPLLNGEQVRRNSISW